MPRPVEIGHRQTRGHTSRWRGIGRREYSQDGSLLEKALNSRRATSSTRGRHPRSTANQRTADDGGVVGALRCRVSSADSQGELPFSRAPGQLSLLLLEGLVMIEKSANPSNDQGPVVPCGPVAPVPPTSRVAGPPATVRLPFPRLPHAN